MRTYTTLARYTHQLRQAQRQQLNDQDGRGVCPAVAVPPQPSLTARRATWLTLRPQPKRRDQDEALLARLQAQHSEIAKAMTLARGFAHLVRQRLPENLDPWLEHAAESTLTQFQQFARSLQEDYEAVKAGVTFATSNGQVEGQINRLKMLKRQMYGRAGFNLLQRRVLLAS